MKSSLVVLLVLLGVVSASMDLSAKNTIYAGMPDYDLDSVPYTLTTAPDSGNCKVNTCTGGVSQANYFATYMDGPRILICICVNSLMNITGMAFRQGQVPLSVRSSVATIISASSPDGKGGGAYTLFNDVAYFGNFVPNVFIHESAHALDFAQGNMYGSLGLSGTDAWQRAINQSSCVPDPYAKTNEVEDWAQVTVARYGALSANTAYSPQNTSCMTLQMQFAFAALTVPKSFDSKDQFYIYNANNQYLTSTGLPDNSPLSLSTQNGNASQVWKIMPTAYDWYIACETNAYKCLDNQRDTSVGKNAITTYRTAFISMQHHFVAQGNGKYKIVNRISGLVLSSGCAGQASNAVLYIADNNNNCTVWSIKSTVVPTSSSSSSSTTAPTSSTSSSTTASQPSTSASSSVTTASQLVPSSAHKTISTLFVFFVAVFML